MLALLCSRRMRRSFLRNVDWGGEAGANKDAILAPSGKSPMLCGPAVLRGSGERINRAGEQQDGTGLPSLVVSRRFCGGFQRVWYGLVGVLLSSCEPQLEGVAIRAHKTTLDGAGVCLARQQ